MASEGAANPNPWPPYGDDYKDCSHGLCSVYCPQWCYAILPPPPPFPLLEADDDGSTTDFSPLFIALIGILAGAFILLAYYAFISRICRRRRGSTTVSGETGLNTGQSVAVTWQGSDNPTAGLDEALIKSIIVYRYKKNERFVDCSDCSVCLSEFEEDERLRLLPKCNHAFHVPCIDIWLMSHSNCPLCRADIAASNQPIETSPEPVRGVRSTEIDVPTIEHHHQIDGSIVVIRDLESESREETVITINDDRGGETQQSRGSVSPNSPPCSIAVSIADILQENEDDDEEWTGVGSSMQRGEAEKSNQRNGVCSFLSRNSAATKRFLSTERIGRHDRGRNCELTN